MARILGKLAGKVVKKYNNLTQDTAGVLTGPINKLWRAKIHLNRLTSGLPKDTAPRGKLFNPNGALGEKKDLPRIQYLTVLFKALGDYNFSMGILRLTEMILLKVGL